MDMEMNKRTSDYIAEQLADQILSGQMAGDTPLRQEELAELLGASRIPVREALQTLVHQGLAVRLATRHIVTADITEKQIYEIYEVIGEIECRILCEIADELTDADEVTGILAGMTELEVHSRICRISNNIYLKNLLQDALEYYVRFALGLSGERTHGVFQKAGTVGHLRRQQVLVMVEQMQDYYRELAEQVIIERRKYS